MSDDTSTALAILALYAACLIAMAAHPPLRHKVLAKLGAWLTEIRYLTYEMPLRLATGRHCPDYARIAELERRLVGHVTDAESEKAYLAEWPD